MSTKRNVVTSVALVAISASASFLLLSHIPASDVVAVLAKLWVLDSVLAGATLALVYKLFDSSYIKGLPDKSLHRLKRLLAERTYRLWSLVGLFTLVIILSAIPDDWLPQTLQLNRARLASGLFICSYLFFFVFVPRMWIELRDFQVEAKRREDELAKRFAFISEWNKEKEEPTT